MPELHLYDFDGTLFRSPEPPMWWNGSWWADAQSLEPPCIPEKPGNEWWIGKVVSQARKSISDQDVWAIVCTGRNDVPFRWRVPELLHQKGLRFDQVFLNPGGSTSAFKRGVIQRLLRKYPDIDTVHIWEDRENHLRSYVSFVESLGRRAVPHFIREKGSNSGAPMPPLCQENPEPPDLSKPPLYAGLILDPESKAKLLRWAEQELGEGFTSKFAHHMTMMVKPSFDDLATLPLGKTFSIQVTGFVKDDKAQVVIVDPGSLRVDNKTPHVTVTTQSGVKPAYSNQLLAKGSINMLKGWGPTLTGRVGWNSGKAVYFESPTMSKTAAGTTEDITRNIPDFKRAWVDFQKVLDSGINTDTKGTSLALKRFANGPWVNLMNLGFKIVEGILSTKSIPPRKAKGLEMTYRLYATSRRMPKDLYKWWQTNAKRIALTVEAAETWQDKQAGTNELFTLGVFTVHNTVGASGPELESLKKAIEKVEKLIRKNPVPGFSKTLYGDIHVVSRITQAHHAAWYYPSDDSLYLRRSKKTGLDEVHAMVHELGHRYWAKFASKSAKDEWRRHHWRVEDKDVEVDLPDVGDTIPVKVRGVKGDPVVTKKEGGRYYFKVPLGGQDRTLSIEVRKIYELLSSKQKAFKNFPTPYSSKNEEEHFCEALALHAMGSLPEEHAIPFDSIWNSPMKTRQARSIQAKWLDVNQIPPGSSIGIPMDEAEAKAGFYGFIRDSMRFLQNRTGLTYEAKIDFLGANSWRVVLSSDPAEWMRNRDDYALICGFKVVPGTYSEVNGLNLVQNFGRPATVRITKGWAGPPGRPIYTFDGEFPSPKEAWSWIPAGRVRRSAQRVAKLYMTVHGEKVTGEEFARKAAARLKKALRQQQFLQLMKHGGTFGIISPYGSAAAGMSKAESKRRHGLLIGALQKLGYRKIHPMKAAPWADGEYREKSVLVPGMKPQDLFRLAREFKQDAVIYKSADGVIGMYHPDKKMVIVAVDPQGDPVFEMADDQSLYSKDRNWSFEFGFAWGDEIPWNGTQPISRKELRQHFSQARKTASRPGPHWNPWPSQGSDLQGEIQALEFYLKNEDLFYRNYPDADDYTLDHLSRLVHALKRQDRTKAKMEAQWLSRSSVNALISNTIWAFIRDGRTMLAAVLDVLFSVSVGNWYGKPSSVAVVEGHGGRYAISLMQGAGFIQDIGNPNGYSNDQEAIREAKRIAARLKRGDGSVLSRQAAYGRPKYVHSETQAMLKKLWKKLEGVDGDASDLEKKLKKLHGDLEDRHYEAEQKYVKEHPDNKWAADDFNESKEGLKLSGERDYVEWAQGFAKEVKDGLHKIDRGFSDLGI